jgi:hypothetical protein
MRKILYNVKKTRVNTDYLEIETEDMAVLQFNILGILMYMNELSISKNKDVRDFHKWFNTTNKKYHYNNKLKRHNSPQSLLSGCMNNIQFGYQYNFTLLQLEVLQDVINTSIDILLAIEEVLEVKLQERKMFEKIFVQENLWITE